MLRSGDRSDARELLALQELERGAAARRDPADALGQAELGEGAGRVGAAHDGEAVTSRDGLRDRLRPLGEAWPLEDAHRPVPEDGSRLAQVGGEEPARLR